MSLLGLGLLVSACATVSVDPPPYQCIPLNDELLDEYERLTQDPTYAQLRAWVRETDKVCRANAALVQPE